jgi:Fe-Mn family superoxide dismutase
MLPGRGSAPGNIADWADECRRTPIVAYCATASGQRRCRSRLRRRGFDAHILAGGIAAWHAVGGPTVPLTPNQGR